MATGSLVGGAIYQNYGGVFLFRFERASCQLLRLSIGPENSKFLTSKYQQFANRIIHLGQQASSRSLLPCYILLPSVGCQDQTRTEQEKQRLRMRKNQPYWIIPTCEMTSKSDCPSQQMENLQSLVCLYVLESTCDNMVRDSALVHLEELRQCLHQAGRHPVSQYGCVASLEKHNCYCSLQWLW